jgi:nitrogen fixation protein FixH
MSYIRWIPLPGSPHRSSWRWFPWAVVAAMTVVVAVNAGMIYAALDTFPGKAGDDDFGLSNRYNQVLDQVQREAALGWTVQAQPDATARPVVILTDRSGAPLTGASLTGTAERPLGATETQRLIFHEAAAGHYVADIALPLVGQWELSLFASALGHDIATTRRIIVR